jgi:hypothetical protein
MARVAPDTAAPKRSKRSGRERGCWTYIDAEQLQRAGLDPQGEPPYYVSRGYQRSKNGHSVIVSLYREP